MPGADEPANLNISVAVNPHDHKKQVLSKQRQSGNGLQGQDGYILREDSGGASGLGERSSCAEMILGPTANIQITKSLMDDTQSNEERTVGDDGEVRRGGMKYPTGHHRK